MKELLRQFLDELLFGWRYQMMTDDQVERNAEKRREIKKDLAKLKEIASIQRRDERRKQAKRHRRADDGR